MIDLLQNLQCHAIRASHLPADRTAIAVSLTIMRYALANPTISAVHRPADPNAWSVRTAVRMRHVSIRDARIHVRVHVA
jgi:hypothetical protein